MTFLESARKAFVAKTGPENHPDRLGSSYSDGPVAPKISIGDVI